MGLLVWCGDGCDYGDWMWGCRWVWGWGFGVGLLVWSGVVIGCVCVCLCTHACMCVSMCVHATVCVCGGGGSMCICDIVPKLSMRLHSTRIPCHLHLSAVLQVEGACAFVSGRHEHVRVFLWSLFLSIPRGYAFCESHVIFIFPLCFKREGCANLSVLKESVCLFTHACVCAICVCMTDTARDCVRALSSLPWNYSLAQHEIRNFQDWPEQHAVGERFHVLGR